MSAATRRKIAQLRALAASTTFPEEAKSARAKADKLEAELRGPEEDYSADALAYLLGGLGDLAGAEWNTAVRAAMQERWQAMFDEAMGRKKG